MNDFIQSEIEPIRTSLRYKLAIVGVGIVMATLPVIYVAMMFCVGWLLVNWATFGLVIIKDHANWITGLIYATPIVALGVLLLFMIKPIFTRRPRRNPPVVLKGGEHPRLERLIKEICEVVRAPIPYRMYVTADVNAFASFHDGIFGVITNRLDLTIGLPLVDGLPVASFGGVIAHELGHFGQGVAMRFNYFIGAVNRWFVRVVYERDQWDNRIAGWCDSGDWRIVLLGRTSLWAIGATRLALSSLMKFGVLISSYLSRQMEFNADAHEVLIAGTDAFCHTMQRMKQLNYGVIPTNNLIRDLWYDRMLPTNYAEVVVRHADAVTIPDIGPPEPPEDSNRFRTHPTDEERIVAAKTLNAQGSISSDGSATNLFDHYQVVSASVSLAHYAEVLGRVVTVDDTVDVAFIDREFGGFSQMLTSLRNLLGWTPIMQDPLHLNAITVDHTVSPKELIREVEATKSSLSSGIEIAREAYDEFCKADDMLCLIAQADALRQASIPWPEELQTLLKPDGNTEARSVDVQLASRETKLKALQSRKALFERWLTMSLQSAAFLPESGSAGAVLREIENLLAVVSQFGEHCDAYDRLRRSYNQLRALGERFRESTRPQAAVATFNTFFRDITRELKRLHIELSKSSYPFEHRRGSLSMADYTFPSLSNLDGTLQETRFACEQFLNRYSLACLRIIGRLVSIAEDSAGRLHAMEQAATAPISPAAMRRTEEP